MQEREWFVPGLVVRRAVAWVACMWCEGGLDEQGRDAAGRQYHALHAINLLLQHKQLLSNHRNACNKIIGSGT